MSGKGLLIGVVVVGVIGSGVYYLSRQSVQAPTLPPTDNQSVLDPKGTPTPALPEANPAGGGSYESYAPAKLAEAESGKVVLFFRASWCPTCRALDADIKSHLADIPDGLTILDVDYDQFLELRQKYGVTYQHTLVQVDAAGHQLAKWSGSPTLASLVSEVK